MSGGLGTGVLIGGAPGAERIGEQAEAIPEHLLTVRHLGDPHEDGLATESGRRLAVRSRPSNRGGPRTGKVAMKPVTCPPAVTGDSGEQLLTVREVADVLGLGPRAVRDYVARGELSGGLIRGRWRFGRKDIEEFLALPPKWELRLRTRI